MKPDFNQRIILHYQANEALRLFLETRGLAVELHTDDYWTFYVQARIN